MKTEHTGRKSCLEGRGEREKCYVHNVSTIHLKSEPRQKIKLVIELNFSTCMFGLGFFSSRRSLLSVAVVFSSWYPNYNASISLTAQTENKCFDRSKAFPREMHSNLLSLSRIIVFSAFSQQ